MYLFPSVAFAFIIGLMLLSIYPEFITSTVGCVFSSVSIHEQTSRNC
jgi:hypothetical protein